jgi:hypothetical protein
MKRQRIAWFSPLGGGTSSPDIASYVSRQVLPILRDHFEIVLFHSEVHSSDLYGLEQHHFLCAMREHQKCPFDLFFYQVEDVPSSFFSRYHLGVAPGLVLFHHYRLLTPPSVAMHHSSFEPVIEIVHQRRSELPPFMVWPEHRGPEARRELALAGGLLFSQYRAFEDYHHFSDPRLIAEPFVSYLPVPVTVSPLIQSSSNICRSPHLKVGMTASPGMEGRAHKVLGALAHRHRVGPSDDVRLVWLIGSDERWRAEELIREYGVESSVELREGRCPERWQQLLPEIDIAAHLHYSAFLSPYPYLAISIAHGIPVMASDPGEAPRLPESLTFGVRPGEHEANEISLILARFAEHRANGHDTHVVAADGVVSPHMALHPDGYHFSASSVAAELALAFEIVARAMASLAPRWSALRSAAWRDIERQLASPGFTRLGGLAALGSLRSRSLESQQSEGVSP